MREPPEGLDDAAVLAAVQRHWPREPVVAATHLPVGFGAHHWRIDAVDGPRWFATVDTLGVHHDARSLTDAYAAATVLARTLPFVWAPVPTTNGAPCVALGPDRLLSLTPWTDAPVAGDGPLTPDLVAGTAAMLTALHATTPPSRLPRWRPRVGPDLADRLSRLVDRRWDGGPHGTEARTLVADRVHAIAGWTERYHALADVARGADWVVTHGEPHSANQLLLPDGPRLVDWESVALAPRERDLGGLVAAGHPVEPPPDPELLAMYDLEWRLDEISQYADRFAGAHTGDADDRIALDGLRHELTRPEA